MEYELEEVVIDYTEFTKEMDKYPIGIVKNNISMAIVDTNFFC
jgi:hypothetical protein